MKTSSNEALVRRVARLERKQRIVLLVALATMAVAALLGASPADKGEVVVAERFELINGDGAVVAVLGTDDEGASGLFIRDAAGGLRLSLAHDQSQSALFVHDAEGAVRIGVAQFAHGGGGLALHGPDSKGAAVLYYKQAGSLSFYDEEGKVTTRVPTKE